MRRSTALGLSLVLLFAAARVASAQNIVSNPGFETGTFSSWTEIGSNQGVGTDFFIPHLGEFGAYFGTDGTAGSTGISQALGTTVGGSYLFSFWLRNPTVGTNSFAAEWGGVTLISLVNAPVSVYTQYVYNVVAASASTQIRFTFQHEDPSPSQENPFWNLDDVSVTLADTVAPEPGSLILLGTGLLGLAGVGTVRRRRRSA